MQGNRRRGPHGPGRIPEKPHDLKKALRDLLAYCRNDLRVIVISLILVNRWHVSFEEIILYSLILTAVCSFGYLILMNERRKRRRK